MCGNGEGLIGEWNGTDPTCEREFVFVFYLITTTHSSLNSCSNPLL